MRCQPSASQPLTDSVPKSPRDPCRPEASPEFIWPRCESAACSLLYRPRDKGRLEDYGRQTGVRSAPGVCAPASQPFRLNLAAGNATALPKGETDVQTNEKAGS